MVLSIPRATDSLSPIEIEIASTPIYDLPRSSGAIIADTMPALSPYTGPVRKLVLGIDVGTTYSGIAYSILDPGEVPKIQSITRYVDHSH